MTINQAPLRTSLVVKSFTNQDVRNLSDIESRLMHLGFFEGASVKVTRKAFLFKEPLLVEVRGRSVALSFEEAELVLVEVQG